jgi:hypothetical protein
MWALPASLKLAPTSTHCQKGGFLLSILLKKLGLYNSICTYLGCKRGSFAEEVVRKAQKWGVKKPEVVCKAQKWSVKKKRRCAVKPLFTPLEAMGVKPEKHPTLGLRSESVPAVKLLCMGNYILWVKYRAFSTPVLRSPKSFLGRGS